ncbi:MAG: hypothetical protein WC325_08390 [Candidatus Bathyarchaeia archaeon]|jgi:hypothetical protein
MTQTPIDLACLNTIEKHAQTPIETPSTTFTTHRKHKKHHKNYEQSITSSMPFSIDYLTVRQGLFNGEMTHLSFDCPKNLRNMLNTAVKANGTSVCKILTEYAAAYIDATMIKQHALANTLLEPKRHDTVVNVGINELSFTQNVQNRPRRFVDRNVEAVVNDEFESERCGIGDCGELAVETLFYQPTRKDVPKQYRVCKLHYSSFVGTEVWCVKPKK